MVDLVRINSRAFVLNYQFDGAWLFCQAHIDQRLGGSETDRILENVLDSLGKWLLACADKNIFVEMAREFDVAADTQLRIAKQNLRDQRCQIDSCSRRIKEIGVELFDSL